MMNEKAIYFDMDGTLAGLFYVKNFSARLNGGDVQPYAEAKPLYNIEAMTKEIARLKDLGYVIGVISYVQNDAEFNKKARKVKKEWLAKYFPFATEIHIVNKSRPKHKVAKIKNSILVDDARANREAWTNGKTINAYRANLVAELAKITE